MIKVVQIRLTESVSAPTTNRHSFFRPAANGGVWHAEKLSNDWPTAMLGEFIWRSLRRTRCALVFGFDLHDLLRKETPLWLSELHPDGAYFVIVACPINPRIYWDATHKACVEWLQ
jgi:hypothetical protein